MVDHGPRRDQVERAHEAIEIRLRRSQIGEEHRGISRLKGTSACLVDLRLVGRDGRQLVDQTPKLLIRQALLELWEIQIDVWTAACRTSTCIRGPDSHRAAGNCVPTREAGRRTTTPTQADTGATHVIDEPPQYSDDEVS